MGTQGFRRNRFLYLSFFRNKFQFSRESSFLRMKYVISTPTSPRKSGWRARFQRRHSSAVRQGVTHSSASSADHSHFTLRTPGVVQSDLGTRTSQPPQSLSLLLTSYSILCSAAVNQIFFNNTLMPLSLKINRV